MKSSTSGVVYLVELYLCAGTIKVVQDSILLVIACLVIMIVIDTLEVIIDILSCSYHDVECLNERISRMSDFGYASYSKRGLRQCFSSSS